VEVPLACLGSMAAAVQPNCLWNNVLQNLFLNLPPQTVGMNETSILPPASCPASPTSAANVELRFARILLSFSIDNFHSVNTVLVGDDTTLHLQLTRSGVIFESIDFFFESIDYESLLFMFS